MSTNSIIFGQKSNKIKYTLKSYDKLIFEGNWNSIPHSHPYCEIMIVLNGEGNFLCEQTLHIIQKGSIILTNPYISHTEYADKTHPDKLEYIVISLTNICFYSKNLEKLLTSQIFDFSSYWYNIINYIKAIDIEIQNKELYWENNVKNIINNLIVFLIRITKLNTYNIDENNISRQSHLIKVVKQYIDENYQDNITLDELSSKFFVNKFYLLRQFKVEIGLTPIKYLELTRIEKAKQLILNTNLTFSEISIQTGFNSVPYFSSKFKKITHLTPSQFLAKNKFKNRK